MKKNLKIIIYCILISFIFLFVFTKSSPLYKINDWVDANAFFTVGKSMFNGVIPFKDLFEQKGPILYFIYGLSSLISYKTFIGVFIMQLISLSIFLYYTHKIIALYLKKSMSYMLLPIITFLITISHSYTHGGSSEEFCFPFLAISIYYFIKILKEENYIKISKEIFIVGIMAGIVLWIKYTLLGFWFFFMASIFFILLFKKNYKKAFYYCFIYLLGMFLVSVPVLVYFLYNNSIKELVDVYFIFNIESYSSNNNTSIFYKLLLCLKTMLLTYLRYFQYILLIIIPLLHSLKIKYFFKENYKTILVFLSFIFLSIGIFVGGTSYRYYSLILQPYMVLGLIYIIDNYTLISSRKWVQEDLIIPCSILIIILLGIGYFISGNTKYISWKKSDYAQYKFLDYIKEENPSILNYGYLDAGFYLTTGYIPKNLNYFHKINVQYKNYPKNIDEQNRYIIEKKVDYVVVRKPLNISIILLDNRYEKIVSHKQIYENKIREYELYRVIR